MSVEWISPEWPAPTEVRAASTLRRGGVSSGPYASLNLGAHVGDAPDAVARNRALVANALEFEREPLWLQQVHGAEVIRADAGADAAQPTADASVAFAPARPCVVLTADCLPVLLCDRAGTRVAAAHAGWRGLARGVLQATVARLACDPSQLLAWLGPAIGPAAFEVGEEVRDIFVRADLEAVAAFERNPGGRWQADLYTLAKFVLGSVGVQSVYGGAHCTYAGATDFFSYRRDGATGRMATMVWLSAQAR